MKSTQRDTKSSGFPAKKFPSRSSKDILWHFKPVADINSLYYRTLVNHLKLKPYKCKSRTGVTQGGNLMLFIYNYLKNKRLQRKLFLIFKAFRISSASLCSYKTTLQGPITIYQYVKTFFICVYEISPYQTLLR